MNILIGLAVILAVANAVSFYDLLSEEWTTFKMTYKKIYRSDIEEKFRMKIFMENRHKIAKHNQLYEQGLVTYQLGLNKYADMLRYEVSAMLNGFNKTGVSRKLKTDMKIQGATFIPPANVEMPSEMDWRRYGAVTPVKDQGQCGSCWAFSSTGALEGQHFRQTGKLVSLSEQNLIDCSTRYGNDGCNGGWMDYAFAYIKDNGGIDTEKTYPYEAEDDQCRYNPRNSGAEDRGFVDIESGNEAKLKSAVATVGPISVAIDASHLSFHYYLKGIYNEPACSRDTLDHAVLVVGYGTEDGLDYWLVKNSWGTTWGDNGYIKMSRNKNNQCGIATKASYPLV